MISLGAPTHTAVMPDPRQAPESFAALAGGLHTRAALIEHDVPLLDEIAELLGEDDRAARRRAREGLRGG